MENHSVAAVAEKLGDITGGFPLSSAKSWVQILKYARTKSTILIVQLTSSISSSNFSLREELKF